MRKLSIVCTITSFVSIFYHLFFFIISHMCTLTLTLKIFSSFRLVITILHYQITLYRQYASVYSINFTYFDTQYDGSKNGHRPTKFCSHINTPTLSNRSNLYLQPYTINIFSAVRPHLYFGFHNFFTFFFISPCEYFFFHV